MPLPALPALPVDATLLIAGLAGLTVFVGVSAVLSITAERQRKKTMMARAARGIGQALDPDFRPGAAGWLGEALTGLFTRLGESMKPKKQEDISSTKLQLIQAGYRRGNTVAVYWGIKGGLSMLGLILFLAFYLLFPDRVPTRFLAFSCLATVTAFLYLPGIWLRVKIDSRKEKVRNGLPDALDLLVVCVEAGMGLDQAINRVAAEIRMSCPELSEELRLLTLELRAGKGRRDGLKNLAMRIGLDDMNSLVALLIQADIFGTSVATTLRVYSDTMRTKRQQRAEELAAKLPVKLLLPLILFILPPLFVIIIGPGVIRLIGVMATMNR